MNQKMKSVWGQMYDVLFHRQKIMSNSAETMFSILLIALSIETDIRKGDSQTTRIALYVPCSLFNVVNYGLGFYSRYNPVHLQPAVCDKT